METTYEIAERFYISLVKTEMEFYKDYDMANRNYLLSFSLYVPLKGGIPLGACGKSSLEAQFVFT